MKCLAVHHRRGDIWVIRYIIDHMATNVDRIPTYRRYVELEYTDTAATQATRRRIEAMCEGTSVYRALKRLAIQEQT